MKVTFPQFSGTRCLMMPYIQGDPTSVPEDYKSYWQIIADVFVEKGKLGFLTIDESTALKGKPHRGQRAKYQRAIHTEAGKRPFGRFGWGGGGWGRSDQVVLDRDVRILLANNIDDTCAVWNVEHENTSQDGDIGYAADSYPYSEAVLMKSGEVHEIGILTPHESLPVQENCFRQFLRIISSGVYGREEYFTINPMMGL